MAAGLIDLERIEELKEQIGTDIFKTLFSRYINEVEKMIVGLCETSAKNQDVSYLINEIHKVSGSSATFGAMEMQKILNQFENLCKDGSALMVICRLVELKEIWNASKQSYQDEGLLNA